MKIVRQKFEYSQKNENMLEWKLVGTGDSYV